MTADKKPEDFTVDELLAIRQAASEVVNPWQGASEFDALSTNRQKAVRTAAAALAALFGDSSPSGSKSQKSKSSARSRPDPAEDLARMTPEVEQAAGISHELLTALLTLDSVSGFGPQKFKAVFDAGVSAMDIVRTPSALPISGKTGDGLRTAISSMTAEDRRVARERAARQILVASELGARILHYDSPEYPVNVKESNNPVPVLYARGNVGILRNRRVVACVGSREIREPYISLQRDFADFACRAGFAIASGFALGADSTAHRAAFEANGATICVLPCGVDLSFPPENKDLHDQLLRSQNAVFISEFGMGIRAGRLTLQKRNKLIVATSRGVLVGQTSDKGGAMNAFRAGVEQRKSVTTFAPDGTPATNGNLKIAEEHKVHTIAFPATPSPKAWKSWLAELS